MLKKIGREDAILKTVAGEEVLIATKLSKTTTLEELALAVFFIETQEEAEAPVEEVKEEVKESKKDVKKAPKERKRKPIDHGKICALFRAGWSVQKIADEMKASPQTIYNHLGLEGLKNNTKAEEKNVEGNS